MKKKPARKREPALKRKAAKPAPASKRKAPARKRRRSTPLAQSIRDNARALRTLGAAHVKAGSIRLGATGWLTPTGKLGGHSGGFGAVERALDAIRDVPGPKLFSFDLAIRFRGADGRMRQELIPRVGVPVGDKRDLPDRVRSIIHDYIFKNVIPRALGSYTSTPGAPPAGTTTEAQARKALRDVKTQRGLRFRVTFYREVFEHGQAASKTRKKAPARAGAGQRGRRTSEPLPVRVRSRARKLDGRKPAKRAGPSARPRPKGKRKTGH